MCRIAVFIATLAVFGIAATEAQAELISMGKHTVAELRQACGASFTVHADGGGYGCSKSCKGSDGKQGTCTVACDNNNNCNGETPERPAPGAGKRSVTDLNSILTNKVAMETAPHKPAPAGTATPRSAAPRN